MTHPSWVALHSMTHSFTELDKAVVHVKKHTGCNGPRRSVAKRSYPTPEVRGGSREEQPHVQGAVAVRVQEGRKELLHIQGQEGWP